MSDEAASRPAPPRKRKDHPTGRRRLDGEVLDVASAGELLGATEKLVRARVSRGLLPHRRWSGRVIFIRSELLEFMRRLDGVGLDGALQNVAARNWGHA